MPQRPGQLGVDVEVQHAAGRVGRDLLHLECVEAQQPVGLVQPMLALQRRRDRRQCLGRVRDRTEGGVIDPAHAVVAVQAIRREQDVAVVGPVRADDHLRALAGGREARRARLADGRGDAGIGRLARLLRLLDAPAQLAHRAADAGLRLLRGEPLQPALGRQFHVDRQPVGVSPGGRQQLRRCVRDGLEVDVAGEGVVFAQAARDLHQLLHRVVAVADDPAGQEQPLDVVALVEIEGEPHHLLGREARARHVARDAIDAVRAVEHAEVGEQDLQQRHAAAIGRVAVADAHALGAADAAGLAGIALVGAAGRAGGVVLGGVGQDGQLGADVHPRIVRPAHRNG